MLVSENLLNYSSTKMKSSGCKPSFLNTILTSLGKIKTNVGLVYHSGIYNEDFTFFDTNR
jgi:hypothetical protein